MKVNPSNQVDPQLIDAVNAGCIVVFSDEWGNDRTLEARALAVVSGGTAALVGYQLDGGVGIAPEQLWKRIDALSRFTVMEVAGDLPARSIPSQYVENVGRLLALAPNTTWDQTRHITSSDDDA
ncbi:hypothetical protein AB1286_30025 [Trinickia sp. NRRL B-1857]|uniref:hypothetical protein n=1 Tax=Trinickia sp. NRRL B-1857 TaxID=3162879 RepID=UPI003D2C87D8